MPYLFVRPGVPLLVSGSTPLLVSGSPGSGGGSTAVPGAVTGLAVGTVTSSTMQVAWTAPTTGGTVTNYTLQYCTPSGSGNYIVFSSTIPANATSATLTGLLLTVFYDVQVFATNAAGAGAPGQLTHVTTAGYPGPVTGLTLGTPTSTTLPIAWTAPGVGGTITGYTVQYRTPSGSGSYVTASSTVPATQTSYTISGLTAATAYDIQVFATNAVGSGTPATLTDVSTASGSGSGGTLTLPSAPLIPLLGQSNANALSSTDANNTTDSSGVGPILPAMATELASYLGLSGAAMLFSGGSTAFNGNGIYANPTPGNAGPNGTWLLNPNTASGGGLADLPSQMANPSAWVPPSQWTWDNPTPGSGTDASAFLAWANALTSQQKADITAVMFLWHENDSARTYAEKSVWKAAWLQFITLVRAQFGVTNPALMPVFDCTPLPSVGNAAGHAMVYEAVCELAAVSSNAIYVALRQMADCDPSTISAYAGSYHTNYVSYVDYSTRATFFMGQKLGALAGLSRIPSAMGTGAGPVITGASLSGNVVTVTIQHDAGNNLVLNGTASTGAGWAVLDQSYSPDLPGAVIPATAVAIVNATTLAITLAWVPVSAAGARLHYPWGDNRIGYGNAVTDNRASLTYSPGIGGAGSTSGASLGTNMPIQRPITISGGVATLGFPLATSYVAPTAPYIFNPDELSGALPEAGSYTHGVGTIECLVDDMSTSGYTAYNSVEFGFTSSPSAPPATWTQYQFHYNTTLWGANVPTPATAGTWYAWAQGFDASGNLVQRAAGPAFTVT